MSKIDDATRLHHMLDAARESVAFVQGKSRGNLDSDRRGFAKTFTAITARVVVGSR